MAEPSLLDILEKATPKSGKRPPGAWTEAACAVWKELAGSPTQQLLEAAIIFEGKKDRLATADDEPAIRRQAEQTAAEIAEVVAKAAEKAKA